MHLAFLRIHHASFKYKITQRTRIAQPTRVDKQSRGRYLGILIYLLWTTLLKITRYIYIYI